MELQALFLTYPFQAADFEPLSGQGQRYCINPAATRIPQLPLSTTSPTSLQHLTTIELKMKPLPFPLALNIGTDIVHIPRITRLLTQRDYLTRFTRRILSAREQHDFTNRFKETLQLRTPTPSKSPLITPEMTRWLAGRFAAKEAARKAAPGGAASIGWKDVIVHVQEEEGGTAVGGASRRPEVLYLGAGDGDGEGSGRPGRVGRLSISHDGEYVVATVLAAGD